MAPNLALRVAARYFEKHGMEHDTPEALKKYLSAHPNADPKNHTVKQKGSEERSDGGGVKLKAQGQKAHSFVNKLDELPHVDKEDLKSLRSDIDQAVKKGDKAKLQKLHSEAAAWLRREQK